MKSTALICVNLCLFAAVAAGSSVPPNNDSPAYAARTTRLQDIAVHRYVHSTSGVILERRSLLDAGNALTHVEDVAVPAGVTIPDEAFGKVLVMAGAWLGYGRLGPQALANFELTTEMPIVVADRWQFEVRAREDAVMAVGQLANVSTRGYATAEHPLIAGFVVAEEARRVLIRVVGPTLAEHGVSDVMTDPWLVVMRGRLPFYHNGNWSERWDAQETAAVAVMAGAFPLPQGSKDAALAVELPPGIYTVHAAPESGGGGEVLVEVYQVPLPAN